LKPLLAANAIIASSAIGTQSITSMAVLPEPDATAGGFRDDRPSPARVNIRFFRAPESLPRPAIRL
jgi:hypothetical protein